jgi:hypothetical protein
MISLKKTKAIIRIRKSGKDRQNNCQEKKDKRTKNDPTKHYTED